MVSQLGHRQPGHPGVNPIPIHSHPGTFSDGTTGPSWYRAPQFHRTSGSVRLEPYSHKPRKMDDHVDGQ